jgi:hypothetical protein
MAIALFILLVIYGLYRLFRKKRASSPIPAPGQVKNEAVAVVVDAVSSPSAESACRVQTHVRVFERRTYIRGTLIAKFHGELDYLKDMEGFVRERYFDISLYDAELTLVEFRRNNDGPFLADVDEEICLMDIKPNPLPCSIAYGEVSGTYAVLLHEIRLSEVDFNKFRHLHMEEDDLVFGKIEATITGYLLEHFKEEFQVKVAVSESVAENVVVGVNQGSPNAIASLAASILPPPLTPPAVLTGGTKMLRGYQWQEHRNIDDGARSWTNPVYTRHDRSGCLGGVGLVFLGLIAVVVFGAIGAQGIFTLLLFAACGLVLGLFSGLLRPALWLLTAIVFLLGIGSFFRLLAHGFDHRAVAFAHDQSNETSFVVRERTNSNDPDATAMDDSLIIHHRVWKVDNDSTYEGDVWVRTSDLAKSRAFKNRLQPPGDPLAGYDWMLAALRTNDESMLPGVYRLMDSIHQSHRLDSVGFAKMIVSFVQDIPYALVLDQSCNPDLYKDAFIRSYLQTANADCEGFQRFGIYTPVEFMGSLKGDCDTRTLFLYTLLEHYGYDVAILSSEVYSHSLLGVNLPLDGVAYPFHNRRYVLWETTAPQLPPGLLAAPYSNLRNWRVSLTSKN